MKMDKRATIIAAVRTMAINAGVEFDEDVAKIYILALEPFSISNIEGALRRVLVDWIWSRMPPIGYFLQRLPGFHGDDRHARDVAEGNKILAHLSYSGATKNPDLSDPITKYLMENRWRYSSWAATVPESELKWWLREFVEAYEAFDGVGVDLLEMVDGRVKKLASGIGGDL